MLMTLTSNIADPVGMRISGQDNIVVDAIAVQMIQDTIPVGAVSIPRILSGDIRFVKDTAMSQWTHHVHCTRTQNSANIYSQGHIC